jgi:hypothetical protein
MPHSGYLSVERMPEVLIYLTKDKHAMGLFENCSGRKKYIKNFRGN